ncbi:hypothetical protein PVAP13_4NG147942 [Panicum virgatum]|uniref:No apical meristem-associated C-terminal domain-containing protein n=1 Tax=Panicum virgatum TaxID=38727 RepID=A0A8T0T6W3_PANVG|nr:hypothetical protein PVAP13_4NG147942 [Panicum virgatum]
MDQISNDLYWTTMVQGNQDVSGLEDLNFSIPNETQQIEQTATEAQEIDMEGSVVAPRPRSSRPNSKRSKNFDPKEDLVVVSAWLNIVPLCIVGCLAQVNKFCACYEAIERRNQNGATIQDMISDATDMYKGLDQDNKSLTLIHCWNKLKDEDKWKTKRRELVEQEKRNKNKKQNVHAQSTPRQQTGAQANDDAPVQAQAEGALVQEDAEKRPPGQKKAKEALK